MNLYQMLIANAVTTEFQVGFSAKENVDWRRYSDGK